jgi:hypothetical protein
VYLDSDRPTDEELYAFYCDPTLKSPRLLTVPDATAVCNPIALNFLLRSPMP